MNLDRLRDAASLYASLAEADPERAAQLLEELREPPGALDTERVTAA